jgi:diguanylate cyclase (GGDEF)-like protein
LLNFFGIYYLFNQSINKASQNNLMLSGIINKVTVSVLIIDSKKFIIDTNTTAHIQFQYKKSEMIGQHISRFINIDTDKPDTTAKCKDGSQFMAQVEQNAIQIGTMDATILTIRDVTKQQEKEKQLSQMAQHDNLTGLPNRILFDDRLSLEINHMRRENSLLAVMFIDLDRFKPINDNYGHSAGDAVLIQIAQRISSCLRDIDTVSRRGGDEFTVILSGINDITDSEKVANAILVELAKPFIYNDKQIYASASIGISLYPQHGETTEQLLLQADSAMYKAKAKGGNHICMFTESIG